MPDLMENLDVLASLKNAQELLCDMLEDPESIRERVKQVDDLYYQYYDRFYDLIRDEEGGNA